MKARAKILSEVLPVLLAAMLAGLVSGCESVKECSLTCKLWDNGVRSYCEPLSNPDLALFEAESKQDVLVQYSAISDRHDGVLRRSYFLEANRGRIASGKAPYFVHAKPRSDWPAILVNDHSPPAAPCVSTNSYVKSSGKFFAIYREGRPPEDCQLPDYRDDHDVWWRVGLTPFAVTGDAVIAGSVVGFVAGYLYLESGGPAGYCH